MVKNTLGNKMNKLTKMDKTSAGILVVSLALIVVVLTLVLRKCKREGFALLKVADASWVTKGKDGEAGEAGPAGPAGPELTLKDEDVNSIVDKVVTELTNKKDKNDNPIFVNPENYLDMLPKGTILAWYNELVPDGWRICDGQQGTPNLINRFPFGIGGSIKLGNSGGIQNVKLEQKHLPSHNHSYEDIVDTEPHANQGGFDYAFKNKGFQLLGYTPDTSGKHNGDWQHWQKGGKCKMWGLKKQTGNVGSNNSFNILNPYTGVNFIMKL